MKHDIHTPLINAAGFKDRHALYDPSYEHDSCGIGFVARLDGVPGHSVVEDGIRVLTNLEHRGAVGGDKATGDGAGVMMQIPDAFFRSELGRQKVKLPDFRDYGVGMIFLPADKVVADRCTRAFERIVQVEGCDVLAWRHVPVDAGVLGDLAESTRPEIRQIFLSRGAVERDAFARKLYVIRRMIENEAAGWDDADASQFYVVSLSPVTLVYKGLLSGPQLRTFYSDLGDNGLESSFALVHQRYSTNTFPTWSLAQPFRMLAHNGEINTLRGNINQMCARESLFQSDLFGDDIDKIKPIITEGQSDSASLDMALELLVMAGRSLPHAIMMLVPEAWGAKFHMSEDKRAFYEYHAAMMEPWDGPAALVFCDGRYIGGKLDRNGLRPCRYTACKDGTIVMASETGVLDFPIDQIQSRGRLQPGKMFLVDRQQKRIVPDAEIKIKISRQSPYRKWVKENRIELRGLFAPSYTPKMSAEELLQKQHAFGYTAEELKMIIGPMASQGQEPVGSMGNDAALAVLSDKPQLLFNYFKQLFAQVTNPPIDPLREELVMSLMSYVGPECNILWESSEHCRRLKLSHFVLTPRDMQSLRHSEESGVVVRDLDMLFPAGGDGTSLEVALNEMFLRAESAIAAGANILVLTDYKADKSRAAIPSLLATAGLHHHLIRRGLRNAVGLLIETGEAREVMHFALLLGYGANAICPYVAFATASRMAEQGLLEVPRRPEIAMDLFTTAVKKGILKTMSRMGISTIRSYCGAQIFEAIGLGRPLVDRYFCGTPSRVGGIGLYEIARESDMRHRKAFAGNGQSPPPLLEAGGNYRIRTGGERHLWTPESIYKLQHSTRTNDFKLFREYSRLIDDQARSLNTLRGMLRFKQCEPVPLEEVEPAENIFKRFASAAMSFGSISREAHETLAIALNRIGGRSNSGEGGEDPARYEPLPNGDSKCSKTKQVASGRFGVTIDYLVSASELQIKMAQGAKPGEGGQLPGHKVSKEIGRIRHTTPGVTLISPPPHHDIYSIEDLAQLIYDLKSANPKARVSVKLVSEVGVGTVAAGVSKAKADMVLISGHDGGTGASPLTSIKHAGIPWELGLSETHQTLAANRLRDRIRVQVDGQIKTGRDLAIAALLGAEEFGCGTALLVCLGCVMMRKCHLNTCPVGVATQDEELRKRFTGRPEYVVNFFRFITEELRLYMAQMGFRTVDEMVGRSDMLEVIPDVEHWKADKLDFSSILTPAGDPETTAMRCLRSQDHDLDQGLDNELIKLCEPAIGRGESVSLTMPIRNVHRTVGATLSGEIVKRHGAGGLPDDTVRIDFTGSAGQSFGAFLAPGISMRLEGDANDYLGKGMSGGLIVLTVPPGAGFVAHESIIAGNVVLYGATGGEMYIRGIAGERFCVRNSGAKAVVEGVGDHGCEYMTGGVVVILGPTGYNFAAGMSGGVAYVYDDSEYFDTRCNLDMVDLETVWKEDDQATLKQMIQRHYEFTVSERAKMLLDNWEAHLPFFVKVMPIDYRKALERMAAEADLERETVSATEEVYRG